MIRHALTLEHVAKALHTQLKGAAVVSCWTQEKHTLDIQFHYSTQHGPSQPNYLRIDLDQNLGSIQLRSDTHRARKNTVDAFEALVGQTCQGVETVSGDRIVKLRFSKNTLYVLMYSGGKANIVLDDGTSVVDSLDHKREIVGKPFDAKPMDVLIGKHYATLGISDNEVVRNCRATTTYYVLVRDREVLFSLLKIPDWVVQLETDDVFEAIRVTVSKRRFMKRYTELYDNITRSLNRERAKLAKAVDAMQKEAEVSDRAGDYRHFGDLLMSQPNPTLSGVESVDVDDWSGERVSIELDSAMSLIENAQRYFAKGRKAELSAKERKERLPATIKRLEEVDAKLLRLQTITDINELESMVSDKPESKGQEPATKYREFELADGYVLYVGRNASNNDELTMKFAKQNDIWLHARGSSGSHAVLRSPAGETKPPKKILEAAAMIAAYYSGARNASWTPVVYTLKKYVRKPKGANVGAVVLEREEVIMVKPALPAA